MRVEAHPRQQCRGYGRLLDKDVSAYRSVVLSGSPAGGSSRSPIVFGMRRVVHPFHFPDSASVAESAQQWVYREDYQ